MGSKGGCQVAPSLWGLVGVRKWNCWHFLAGPLISEQTSPVLWLPRAHFREPLPVLQLCQRLPHLTQVSDLAAHCFSIPVLTAVRLKAYTCLIFLFFSKVTSNAYYFAFFHTSVDKFYYFLRGYLVLYHMDVPSLTGPINGHLGCFQTMKMSFCICICASIRNTKGILRLKLMCLCNFEGQ